MLREDRLRALEDIEEIRSLKYRYCRFADAMDVDGMLSVFTDDCVAFYRPDDVEGFRGVAALREFYASAQSVVTASSHHLSNIDIIFRNSDEAAVYSYLYSWQRFAGFPDVPDRHRWARYEDVMVRTASGWRQSRLRYLVAGELGAGGQLRSGEPQALSVWDGRKTG
jgi:ketosteroid isomerase-like protein